MFGALDPSALLTVVAAGFAALYGTGFAGAPASWARTLVKTAAVAPLALLGLLIGAPAGIVAGLALGALGDALLSRPGQATFLAGVAAFGAGHLAYAAAFLPGLDTRLLMVAALPILALALSTELWLQPRAGRLAWPLRGYVLVISAMALAAFALGPGHAVLKLGAALFLISDLLLAIELFVRAGRPSGALLPRAIWLTYWLGQALILVGGPLLRSPV